MGHTEIKTVQQLVFNPVSGLNDSYWKEETSESISYYKSPKTMDYVNAFLRAPFNSPVRNSSSSQNRQDEWNH